MAPNFDNLIIQACGEHQDGIIYRKLNIHASNEGHVQALMPQEQVEPKIFSVDITYPHSEIPLKSGAGKIYSLLLGHFLHFTFDYYYQLKHVCLFVCLIMGD